MSDLSHRSQASTGPELEFLPAGPEVETAATFDLKEKVVCGLWRSKLLIAVLVALGLAGGLVAAAASPNTYTSSARMRLRLGKVETFSLEEIFGAEVDRPSYFSTADEVFLLQDPAIYMQVAIEVGPQEILEPPDPTRFDTDKTPAHVVFLHRIQKFLFRSTIKPHCQEPTCETCLNRAAGLLQARTTLVPERSSSVISLYHTSYSAELAQRVAQALVNASVERHRKEFAVSQYLGLNKETLDESYASLVSAKEEYEKHRQQCGFVDIIVQRSNLLEAKSQVQSDLRKDQADREGVQAQMRTLRVVLEATPQMLSQAFPAEKAVNDEYTQWTRQINELKLQRAGVRRQTGRTIEWIEAEEKRLDDSIEQYQRDLEKIEKYVITVPERLAETPNPNYDRLRDRILDLEADDERLNALIESSKASRDSITQEFERLLDCEKTHQYWELEIANRQKAYSKLSEKNAEVESLALLDVQPEANLRELLPASLPLGKDGPKRSKQILIGLFGGAALGIGAAMARHLLDRSLRYPVHVERDLGLPLLGVVPELRALSGVTRRKHVA